MNGFMSLFFILVILLDTIDRFNLPSSFIPALQ